MLDEFLNLLKEAPPGDVFNPWWEVDFDNDKYNDSYKVRQQNLRSYFSERLGQIQYIMLAEALGYQGGHFTGIPMTSERLLLGELEEKQLFANYVFTGKHQRTSKEDLNQKGFNEPTATIVWSELVRFNLTHKTILWNSFPWHPYKKENGFLSNRTPTSSERRSGREVLKYLKARINNVRFLAIGRQAEQQLAEIGESCDVLRHPAHGGANIFKQQMRDVISGQYSELRRKDVVLRTQQQY